MHVCYARKKMYVLTSISQTINLLSSAPLNAPLSATNATLILEPCVLNNNGNDGDIV